MIYLFANIQNPWHNEHRWPWRALAQASWTVTKNKTLELCVDFHPHALLHLNVDTRWYGQDHAGPKLEFGLLGIGINIGLNDKRHWNYKRNNWLIHD